MRISDWSSDVCSSDLASDGIVWTRLANPSATRATFAWRADRIASGRLIASPASNAAAASRTCAASRSGTRANADQNDPITPPPHAHRAPAKAGAQDHAARSEEHTSELQSLMRISYAVFCLKKKKQTQNTNNS